MAKKAPAKKVAKKSAATKTTKKAAAKAPAKKVVAKPPKAPPPKKPGTARGGKGGPTIFTVCVDDGSLTMSYGGGPPQDFEMLLFIKDDEDARRVQECIDKMGLHKLLIARGKAYSSP